GHPSVVGIRPRTHAGIVEGKGGSSDAPGWVEGDEGPVGIPDEAGAAVVQAEIVPHRHTAVVDGGGGSVRAEATGHIKGGDRPSNIPDEAVVLIDEEIAPSLALPWRSRPCFALAGASGFDPLTP